MQFDFLLKVFEDNKTNQAIIWKDNVYPYSWLIEKISYWQRNIEKENIKPGSVVIIEADFSPNSVALYLALIFCNHIIVPLTKSVGANKPKFISIAQGEYSVLIDGQDNAVIKNLNHTAEHEIYKKLRELGHPGLILFSSGSTGESKAAVHDITGILEKFKIRRNTLRTITFLLYDHIGGVNTMFYILSNAGCIITVEDRNPDKVLRQIEKYKAELLPTSPTFLNLVLLSEAYKNYDISSLKTITYGTEPMPEITLKRFHELFPDIKMQQTYGLSELGILRSKSKSSDSLWVKIGGEGFETRVVEGILQIKARSAMMGYLNAPSPFTNDGWFNTGDRVEVEGEYFKILGRYSEIINVGGEKVYPTEVENVIQSMDNVAEVTVFGENNPITGMIVCARVRLKEDEDEKLFVSKLKKFCRERLQPYKVPIKVFIISDIQYSDRFKKKRKI